MREYEEFLKNINSSMLIEKEIIKINDKRFIINTELLNFIKDRSRLTYIGTFIGRTKKTWNPSTILLEQIAKEDKTNKIWVNDETAWLFVCGRDIFIENILKSSPQIMLGLHYLVMNNNDCLGVARADTIKNKIIMNNIFDVGDFLRREKKLE
ncbi:hypothetical protein FJY84_06565 [Candidatus Bathyarchaeota archaeon]|nr:hypothetical protein [Candidatus Bathyarchaeota archaeon]